jgi:putative membrane protein
MEAGVIRIVTFAGLLVCGADATAQEIAYAKNDVRPKSELPEKSVAREVISNFIISSAAAREICAQEGRLAAEKGTTEEIKAYGELMIKDQGRLLGELKRLAVLNDITIPEKVYENDLHQKSGKQFNHAFVRTMIMEHERDIKAFKEAMTYGDPEVSAFTARYLPLIESHLALIKAIRR